MKRIIVTFLVVAVLVILIVGVGGGWGEEDKECVKERVDALEAAVAVMQNQRRLLRPSVFEELSVILGARSVLQNARHPGIQFSKDRESPT